jgi:hypothetical protein
MEAGMYTVHRPSQGNSIVSHALLTGHVLLGDLLGLELRDENEDVWLDTELKLFFTSTDWLTNRGRNAFHISM